MIWWLDFLIRKWPERVEELMLYISNSIIGTLWSVVKTTLVISCDSWHIVYAKQALVSVDKNLALKSSQWSFKAIVSFVHGKPVKTYDGDILFMLLYIHFIYAIIFAILSHLSGCETWYGTLYILHCRAPLCLIHFAISQNINSYEYLWRWKVPVIRISNSSSFRCTTHHSLSVH